MSNVYSDIKNEKASQRHFYQLIWFVSNFAVEVGRNRQYKHCTALLILKQYTFDQKKKG